MILDRSKHDDIAQAGEAFVLHLYNKSNLKLNLDELRYYLYKQTVAKQTLKDNFQLSSLPPTKAATRQHSYYKCNAGWETIFHLVNGVGKSFAKL